MAADGTIATQVANAAVKTRQEGTPSEIAQAEAAPAAAKEAAVPMVPAVTEPVQKEDGRLESLIAVLVIVCLVVMGAALSRMRKKG